MTINSLQTILEEKEVTLKIGSQKYTIRRIPKSPCKAQCPINTNVKAYLSLIAVGNFEKALEVVKRDNPFPGVCGRVCNHPCEDECSRGKLDQPLSICALKRFLADWELKKGRKKQKPIPKTGKEKIAIVGSGPAGLAAANDLVRLGYKVTVFEALPVAGGMLRVGIPAYRLPKEIIETEIEDIKKLGVKIKTNTKITDLNELKKKGYKAIFLAIGAHKGLKLGIPGEDELSGVIDCIDFLKSVNLSSFPDFQNPKLGKKVIVIGGGNAAIDAARSALRLNSDVHIVYRRSREEMPANPWEIEEAEKEGVKIHYLASPVRLIGKNGKVTALECIKNKLGAPDASGRRRPVPIPGSEFRIEVDTIILAISQEPDISFLPEGHGLQISKWNLFVVDEETLATNIPGIFAGGDCVTGPKTVIEAIAAGKKAAKSIHSYLNKEARKPVFPQPKESEIVIEPEGRQVRVEMPKLSLEERKSFEEVELGIDEEMAIYEARRCLRCGSCFECSECVKGCNKRILSIYVKGELSGMLLRAPVDSDKFPVNGRPVNGHILLEKKEIPVFIEPMTARVNEELCRGCGKCEEICEYSVPKLQDKGNGVFISKIDASICKGCGVCASVCPSHAIVVEHFRDKWIHDLIEQGVK